MRRQTRLEMALASVRRQLPGLFGLSFLLNLLLLSSSVYTLQLFDRVLSSGSVDTLVWLTVIVVAALVAYGFLEQARRKVLMQTGSWIEAELGPEVLRRGVAARLARGRSEATLADVTDVKSFLGGDAVLAFLDAPWSPVFIAVIWLMNPLLGVIALCGAVVLFGIALLNDALTRRAQAEAGARQRGLRDDAGKFLDSADTLAGLGMIGAVAARWKARHGEAEAAGAWQRDASTMLFNASRVLRLGLQAGIMGAGAWLVLKGDLTSGGMIAASIILGRALSPVERAISAWRGFGSYRAARARIARLFALMPETAAKVTLPRPEGRLEARDLRFYSPQTREPILRGVSFALAPGEICGVLGPSGSGKSTLCRLLVGAWRPGVGAIRLDGADVADWDPEDLGRHLGYLPQSVTLYSGTVAENIARMGDLDDGAVIDAAMRAGAHEMILKLPEGYETDVGLHADRLSGGQRQRIGLARALYRNPSLIVLDEPNSNLDGNGEVALQRALSDLKAEGRTVIVVSHLPNLLRVADRILVLKDGAVARFGPRDEVMREMMQAGRVTPVQAAQ